MAVTGEPDRRFWALFAALSGGMAVAAGAFAAHGLKAPETAALFETAAQYQMVHALAMIGLLALIRTSDSAARIALAGFAVGAVLFSGSLYAYGLSEWRPLVFVTPVGGTAFLIGWGAFAWAAWGQRN